MAAQEQQPQLGVLLVSAARHQSAFAGVIKRHPRMRLVALADESELIPWVRDANHQLADKLGLPYTEDLDAALARPDVDVVTIGSMYDRHGPLAIKALRAGKHVLLDKQPMGMTVAEGEEVFAEAQKAAAKGVKLSYIHHVVNPTVQRAKRLIEEGAIGEPRAVYVSAIVTYGPGENPETDLNSRIGRGLHPHWWKGGELIHHGGYAIGCARYMMGSEITSVYCVNSSVFNRIHRENGSEDLTTLSLGFANGGVGSLVIGRTSNPSHPRYADEFVHVVGTKGVVTANWEDPSFLLCDDEKGLSRRETYGRADTTELAVRDFLSAVLDNREPLQGAADGLAEVKALLLGYQSAREGRTIAIA